MAANNESKIHEPDLLWQKLKKLTITPPNHTLTFEARLAREQAWSLDRSLAVVEDTASFSFYCSLVLIPSPPP